MRLDRKLLGWVAGGVLVFVGVMATLLNNVRPNDPLVLSALRWLAEYELFHLVMHILIFMLVTLAVGLWRERNIWLIVAVLLGGTLLIEGSQVISGAHPLNIFVVTAALYDLAVNAIGALSGWLLLSWHQCAHAKDEVPTLAI